jgi:voltage-gated potassium channel Kch
MVLLLFLAALVELNIWAVTYLAVGAIPDIEPALYFSTVTFTTLGYGDLTLDTNWRLLSSFEAANGTLMFGWSTAIVVAVLHRMVIHDFEAAEAAP